MSRLAVYSKNYSTDSTIRCYMSTYQYVGQFMGDRYVTGSIISPTVIPFEIGDYIELRGQIFRITSLPNVKKQARRGEVSNGYVYSDIRFNSIIQELVFAHFKDCVINDSNIHYTGLETFSYYVTKLEDVADRVRANLIRVYGEGSWNVIVARENVTDRNGNIIVSGQSTGPDVEETSVSVSEGTTVGDGLNVVNETFDVNYIVTVIDDVNTIIIGGILTIPYANLGYGKGRGFVSLEKTSDESSAIITRLHAYGSTRNMPYRYYNKKYNDKTKYPKMFDGDEYLLEASYINRLMLPYDNWVVKSKIYDAYIESNVEKYGIREHTVNFDGSDEEWKEIYPSIEGMKISDIKPGMTGFGNDFDNSIYTYQDKFIEILTNYGYTKLEAIEITLNFFRKDSDVAADEQNFVDTFVTRTKENKACVFSGRWWEEQGKDDTQLKRRYVTHTEHLGTVYSLSRGSHRKSTYSLEEARQLQSEGYTLDFSYPATRAEYGYFQIGDFVKSKTREERLEFERKVLEHLGKIGFVYDNDKGYGSILGWKTEQKNDYKGIYSISESDIEYVKGILDLAGQGESLDVIISGSSISDCGVSGQEDGSYDDAKDINGVEIKSTFTIEIPQIFFNIANVKADKADAVEISMKSGDCIGRNFEVIKCEPCDPSNENDGWRVTCKRDDSDVSTLNKVFPNSTDRIKMGDKFVVLGIVMPDVYVEAAEQRLYNQAIEYLNEYNHEIYSYVPVVDNVFLAEHEDIAQRLMEGMQLPFNDRDAGDTDIEKGDLDLGDAFITIKTLTIKYNETNIPRYEIQLENDVEAVSLQEAITTRVKDYVTVYSEEKLSRLKDDTAGGVITFASGAKFGTGMLDNGGNVSAKNVAASNIGVNNNLTVRGVSEHFEGVTVGEYAKGFVGASNGAQIDKYGNAFFKSVRIDESLQVPDIVYNRMDVVKGIFIISPSAGKIESVEKDLRKDAAGNTLYHKTDADGNLLYIDNEGNEATEVTMTPAETTTENEHPLYGNTGTATVSLETGEALDVKVNDMLLGFWHNEGVSNAITRDTVWEADESGELHEVHNGDFLLAGFESVYFLVTKVNSDGKSFEYQIRPTDDTWVCNNMHPFVGMSYAGYGNRTDASRQSLYIITREYRVQLVGKADWTYSHRNIADIQGKLDGFSMMAKDKDGIEYMKYLSGYGHIVGDLQVYGSITQFDREKFIVAQQLYYLLSETSDVPSSTAEGWTKEPQYIDEEKKYLFEYWEFTYSDGTNDKSAVFLAASKGADGKIGADAVIYSLVPEQTGVNIKADGTYSEERLSVLVQKREGKMVYPSVTYGTVKLVIDNDDSNILTDNEGNTLDFGDEDEVAFLNMIDYPKGGIVLADIEPKPTKNVKFILIDENNVCIDTVTIPFNTDGANGTSIVSQYSSDASSWHDTFAEGDVWMRMRSTGEITWGEPLRIVGERGAAGSNGSYMDYSFGISASPVEPSDADFGSDAPIPTTEECPYLWMKQMLMTWSEEDEGYIDAWDAPKFVRLSGKDGAPGEPGERGSSWRILEWDDVLAKASAGETVWFYDKELLSNDLSIADVMIYNSEHYLCIKKHSITKDDVDSGKFITPANTEYWKKFNEFSNVATGLLLADEAIIHNLIAENVRITNENGETVVDMSRKGISLKGSFTDVPEEMGEDRVYFVGRNTGTPRSVYIDPALYNIYTRNGSRMVFLPTYAGYGEPTDDFYIPSCNESGVNITITMANLQGTDTWIGIDKNEALNWGLKNGYETHVEGLIKHSALICADPLLFIKNDTPINNVDAYNTKHRLGYYDEYDCDGMFASCGGYCRLLMLLPGQTLNLQSSIVKKNGVNVLRWIVKNYSDFGLTAIHACREQNGYKFKNNLTSIPTGWGLGTAYDPKDSLICSLPYTSSGNNPKDVAFCNPYWMSYTAVGDDDETLPSVSYPPSQNNNVDF